MFSYPLLAISLVRFNHDILIYSKVKTDFSLLLQSLVTKFYSIVVLFGEHKLIYNFGHWTNSRGKSTFFPHQTQLDKTKKVSFFVVFNGHFSF